MDTAINFPKQTFSKRVRSMLKVDFIRMFTTPLFYIMVGICVVVPILILVMTTMMGGTTVTDPQTGVETTVEGFTNVWQTISSVSGAGGGMAMDITTMCNMNLVYFGLAVFVCLFVGADFTSGYAKNLFTTRSQKTDYVASKTVVCTVAGMIFIMAFFVGAVLGGSIAKLSFAMDGFNAANLVGCLIAKMFLTAVFVSIPLVGSVFAKQRIWLAIMISLAAGMLLFMMIPMMTPLNAGAMEVILCIAGGAIFAFGIGAISNLILKKTNIV